MCGITGLYSLNGPPISPAEIIAQTETILHRGPDEGGHYLSPHRNCGLGIRRLSIIDVAGGQQPLHNEQHTIHLVYNGETYNHRALRRALEQAGHRPHSHSDAEVVLHGYEEWGVAGVLHRLRGMGAFALWDEARQQLFLARDRFGIKPLYYAEWQGRLYFASEIKAILARSGFPRHINLAALEAMLTVGFVPGPATMFAGIYKLPPGHFLLARDGSFRIKPYWQLDYQPDPHLREAEAAETFLALLREAVQLRLMSEVPLGALLSGGLDSGTLVALANEQGAGNRAAPLKTVSIGFEQPGYNEASLAHHLAEIIGTAHQPVTFSTADFELYPTVLEHLEEPQASATAVPIYKLYQACREAGLTVVLTGEGADELLGGYFWHRGDALVRPLLRLPGPLRRWLAASSLPMSAPARRVLQRGAADIASRYRDWLAVGEAVYQPRLLSAAVRHALAQNGGADFLSQWTASLSPDAHPLHQMLQVEARTRMVDFINFEVDKMSMAHSVEARVPFLDHKLWEFCATLPAHYKLKRGVEKHLLRQATRSLLPDETRTRRKKGLAAPYAAWLRTERLPDWVETALSPQALAGTGLFNPETVLALRQAHRAGQPHLGPLLMGVLSTQLWVDRFGVGTG